MNDFKTSIITTFNSYKCKNQSDELKLIPIFNQDDLIGFLKPVTFHYKLISPEYISLFSQWRRENPVGFATIFEITDKRTEFWLDKILLNREDRILFVVHTLKGEPIGHLGYSSFDFEKKCCEIDNVVRGVKMGQAGIMSFALNSLLLWGKNILKLDEINLRVLADNTHAINFYERNGFKKQFDIPLYKVVEKDEIKWIESKSYDDEMPNRYFTVMKFTENTFQH
jgi:perosamine synthetase